jgi:hypothetical protein
VGGMSRRTRSGAGRECFPFVVSVHDVAPATCPETAAWLRDLERRAVPATLLVMRIVRLRRAFPGLTAIAHHRTGHRHGVRRSPLGQPVSVWSSTRASGAFFRTDSIPFSAAGLLS